ncbi:hypothetical protein [Salmonella phage 7-11]|uniref:Uncharacterized protein n=1 Tax=Salmonella phage 7-11 TaxID=1054968 RepID=G0X4Z5_9CAUD|nr:hypothetical protein SaPh711_gp062 [Salmonella phage 7-11]AEK81977.1 hypothetical protein [Salmonella phage 7-11]
MRGINCFLAAVFWWFIIVCLPLIISKFLIDLGVLNGQ